MNKVEIRGVLSVHKYKASVEIRYRILTDGGVYSEYACNIYQKAGIYASKTKDDWLESALQLPDRYEPYRAKIEKVLPPLEVSKNSYAQ